MANDFRDFVRETEEDTAAPSARLLSIAAATQRDDSPISMWESVDDSDASKISKAQPPSAEGSAGVAKIRAVPSEFPVGWLVAFDGKDAGRQFTVPKGLSTLVCAADGTLDLKPGRVADGNGALAALVYDASQNAFFIGPVDGGIVSRNDTRLSSTEALADSDTLTLGGTRLRFRAFCDDIFSWQKGLSVTKQRELKGTWKPAAQVVR